MKTQIQTNKMRTDQDVRKQKQTAKHCIDTRKSGARAHTHTGRNKKLADLQTVGSRQTDGTCDALIRLENTDAMLILELMGLRCKLDKDGARAGKDDVVNLRAVRCNNHRRLQKTVITCMHEDTAAEFGPGFRNQSRDFGFSLGTHLQHERHELDK